MQGRFLPINSKNITQIKKPIKAKRKGFFNIYRQIQGNLYGDYQVLAKPLLCKKYLDAQLRQNLPLLTNTLRTEFNASSTLSTAVKELIQPEEWEDIPENEGEAQEIEYIEGF
jgi:stalled ribosome rescue protein Dom34